MTLAPEGGSNVSAGIAEADSTYVVRFSRAQQSIATATYCPGSVDQSADVTVYLRMFGRPPANARVPLSYVWQTAYQRVPSGTKPVPNITRAPSRSMPRRRTVAGSPRTKKPGSAFACAAPPRTPASPRTP